MFSGKELCRRLACFVIGGIIAVILIITLEWQRIQNHEERDERQTIIPIQEEGDRERQEERIVQGYTVKKAKIPREQDDLQGIAKKFIFFS